jgi:hypothetical protein
MQQLKLQGISDPFTLLKILQIFREVPVGGELAIFYEDNAMRNELLRVLPKGRYQVASQLSGKDAQPRGMVLRKILGPGDQLPLVNDLN